MASRRNFLQEHEERFPGMMRRGPSAPDPIELFSSAVFDNKLTSQAAEIDRLAVDNHKLANSHLALRQNLIAAQQEAEKLREHIRTLRTEGDIQIRILLDKIGKLEADVRAGDNVKKEHQEAHLEARSLVKSGIELTAQVQQATQNLDNARADVKKLPEMHVELDNLRQEHQRLRKTFEYEKGMNVEKVEEMKILEKDVVAMAEEVERLRAEVLNVDKRASAAIPYGGGQYAYSANNVLPPHSWYGNGGYAESYGGPHLHMVGLRTVAEGMDVYHPGGAFAVGPPLINGAIVNGAGGFAVGPHHLINGPYDPAWGAPYDASHI